MPILLLCFKKRRKIPVYCRIQKSFDPTEEYFRDFRGFKMDQGLGLLLLNGLEWFEIGNNQPMTSASSHFRALLNKYLA